MAVLGIDFGDLNCVIGSVGKGSVYVVRNGQSDRTTPSIVGYTGKQRLIGDAAISLIKSNFSNTCRNLKCLLGCKYNDPNVESQKKYSVCELVEDERNDCAYSVKYKDSPCVFSPTAVLGTLFAALKETAEISTAQSIHDVVIAAPSWYKDVNRKCLIGAAQIAGLNCRRVMNDYTAIALDYGIYRCNEFDETECTCVAFVSIGHLSTSVSIVSFTKTNLKILAEASDRTIGGRDLENVIIEHMANIFEQNSKTSINGNTKALLKLEESCRKAKTILSANQESQVSIECLVGDNDLSAQLNRKDFEGLCEPLALRLKQLIEECLKLADMKKENLHFVEVAGGSTRVPWIQNTISTVFEKPISRTLIMDECVARGCALQAAMCSPLYKVREYGVWERITFPIGISWFGGGSQAKLDSEEPNQAVVFEVGSNTNTSKYVTLNRYGSFEIKAYYSSGAALTAHDTILGTYTIELPESKEKAHIVKVKAKITYNGIFVIEKACLIEEEEVEQTVMEKRPIEPTVPSETDATAGPETLAAEKFEEVPVKRIVKKQKRKELPMMSKLPGLTEADIKTFTENEVSMQNDDRAYKETYEMKNDLESYIYESRDKFEGVLSEFIDPEPKTVFLAKLSETEDWLYDFPEEQKSVYAAKFTELQAIGEPVRQRAATHKAVECSSQTLVQELQESKSALQSPDPMYAHIPQDQKDALLKKCQQVESWINDVVEKHQSQAKYLDSKTAPSEIDSKTQEIQDSVNTLMRTPPRAAPAPEVTTETTTDANVEVDTSMKDADAHEAPTTAETPP